MAKHKISDVQVIQWEKSDSLWGVSYVKGPVRCMARVGTRQQAEDRAALLREQEAEQRKNVVISIGNSSQSSA